MKRSRLACAALVVVAFSQFPVTTDVLAATFHLEGPDEEAQLSPYWHPRVQQWAPLIVQEAERRSLDPDLLASLVWMESRGDHRAVGPVGAVGLTQVMSREAGFDWRPTQEELMDPGTNLFWGTRTLSIIMRQGKGDIFNVLAAYNGGWEQIMYRGPKYFATNILRDYAASVALRHELRASEEWIALFAVRRPGVEGPIWVVDSQRDDVYFFGWDNDLPDGAPLIPEELPPVALAARCETEDGEGYEVAVWFYLHRSGAWFTP